MTQIIAVDFESGKALFDVDGDAVTVDINTLDVSAVSGMTTALTAAAWMKVATHFEYPSVWSELAEAAVTALEVREKQAETAERKFRVPQAVKDEAQQALDWVHGFDRGSSVVGLSIAKMLVSEHYVSLSKISRIARYFSRRPASITEAAGWSPGESGYPTTERIRYSLWGGFSAREWTEKIAAKHALTVTEDAPALALTSSAGAFQHDPNCDYFGHGIDPNKTLVDALYKMDENESWQERKASDWHDMAPPSGDTLVIMLDPDSAAKLADIIDNQAPDNPDILPYELASLNPHEAALVTAALPELDFDLIDRVFDIYDSQERSVNARKQLRDPGGKFGETGAESKHQAAAPKARLSTPLPLVPDVNGLIQQYLAQIAAQRGDQPAAPAPAPAAPAPAPAQPQTPVQQYNTRLALELAAAPVTDVRPLYLAIVDPVDTEAVLDVISLVPPATGQQGDVTCWKRDAGQWVAAPELLQQLRGVQPPPVVELKDDAMLTNVLGQVDQATAPGNNGAPSTGEKQQEQIPTSPAPVKPDANPDQHPVPQAASSFALPDGTFSIRTAQDLKLAIETLNEAKNQELAKQHIATRAKALNRRDLIPSGWELTSDDYKLWGPYGELMNLFAEGGLDQNRGNAEQLRHYWVHGEGAAKIGWNTGGDWYRCVSHLSKYLGTRAKGYCTLRHKDATGFWPGQQERKAEGK